MESTFHNFDSNKCLLCVNELSDEKHNLKEQTKTSNTELVDFIIDVTSLVLPSKLLDSVFICNFCCEKFNEYDYFMTKAKEMKTFLLDMFETCNYGESHQDFTENDEVDEQDTKNDNESVEIDGVEVMFETILDDEVYLDVPNDSTEIEIETTNFVEPEPVKSRKRQPKISKLLGYHNEKDADSKKFKCEICDSSFSSHHLLKTHKMIHTTERNYCCPICSKAFKTPNCVRSHIRIHMKNSYFCDLCDTKCDIKSDLARHIRFFHLNIREFECEICDQAFVSKSHLQTHLEDVHAHPKKNMKLCPLCPSKFPNQGKLKRHMQSHTKDKTHECNICGKLFYYAYNVNAHIKAIHLGKKRKAVEYLCKMCPKKFRNTLGITKHYEKSHKIITMKMEPETENYEVEYVDID